MTKEQIPVVGASEFKAKCLSLLDTLNDEGLIVTKRGKPVARVIPIHASAAELIGSLADQVQVNGDILATGSTWDAES